MQSLLPSAPALHCPRGVNSLAELFFFWSSLSADGTLIQLFVYGSGIESSRSVEGWKQNKTTLRSLNKSITLTRHLKVDSEIGSIFILNECK